MKVIKFFALCALVAMTATMVSCNRASVPRTNLRTSVDTTSYAWGVNIADEGGLMQYLEQMGILESPMAIEQQFDMRMIGVTDSLERVALNRERRAAIDSLNRANAPRLNDFIRGLRQAIDLEQNSAFAAGLSIGAQFSQQMIPNFNAALFGEDSDQSINADQMVAGMVAVFRGQQTAIPRMEAGMIVNREVERAQEEQMARHEEELRTTHAEAIAQSAAFLAENARREGVVTLPSGLQYEIIRAGTGEKPTLNDRVRVHYHGTLIDGSVFDSSVDRQRTAAAGVDMSATFGVTQVIDGWTEALQLMPAGSKWKLFIPYDLAYGAQDRGVIGPFSTLIFEVELLEIVR